MTTEILSVGVIQEKLKFFAKERNWEQFHTPQNIAMALNVEASELLQIFQWLTGKESLEISNDLKKYQEIKHEIADVAVYLLRLCDILKINLGDVIAEKMSLNAEKYPIEKAKGNAKKYSDF